MAKPQNKSHHANVIELGIHDLKKGLRSFVNFCFEAKLVAFERCMEISVPMSINLFYSQDERKDGCSLARRLYPFSRVYPF